MLFRSDFALRKKKQREEQQMTKNVQDSSSEGADLPFNPSESEEDGKEKEGGASG